VGQNTCHGPDNDWQIWLLENYNSPMPIGKKFAQHANQSSIMSGLMLELPLLFKIYAPEAQLATAEPKR
jgi:hypothetical protein